MASGIFIVGQPHYQKNKVRTKLQKHVGTTTVVVTRLSDKDKAKNVDKKIATKAIAISPTGSIVTTRNKMNANNVKLKVQSKTTKKNRKNGKEV